MNKKELKPIPDVLKTMTLKKAKHFWFSSRATSLRVNYK
jgi:hypothetical protein